MSLPRQTLEKYLDVLKRKGESGLYRYCVGEGIMKSTVEKNPEIGMLDLSEKFLIEARLSDNDNFYLVARILRRAAHAVYRQFLKLNTGKGSNERFLNVV